MSAYIVAVDQSTSGTKALVLDRQGRQLAKTAAAHRQLYPRPGWVEHDPAEIYEQVKRCIANAIRQASIEPSEIAVLTITNQRETAVLWDRTTGLPVHPAIVWQCGRTADRCAALREKGFEDVVRAKTGLTIDPYFSAAKWAWMLEHAEGAAEKLRRGELLAGTMDTWLVWKLTGGEVHATDYTNASRTSLYNIHRLEWDEELCALFGVPVSLLPEVKASDTVVGRSALSEGLGARIPIAGVIGDSQAALFGNRCFAEGAAKATYGTGTSVLMNVGTRPAEAAGGLVQAIAWGMDGSVAYALEAIIRSSGDSLQWLRGNLGLFDSPEEMEELLGQVTDSEGVYLVPAFVGLGAPHWEPRARAALTGMNRSTRKAHLVRAAFESMAYQVCDAIEALQAASGTGLKELHADGGGAENPRLMQFQADLLGKTVVRFGSAELSAVGSAYLGGLAAGIWRSPKELPGGPDAQLRYRPAMDAAARARYLSGWKRAVATLLGGVASAP